MHPAPHIPRPETRSRESLQFRASTSRASTTSPRSPATLVAAALGAAAAVAPAWAQPADISPPSAPFLRFVNPDDWTLTTRVQILSCTVGTSATSNIGASEAWQFDEFRVVWPVVRTSAASATEAAEFFSGRLVFGGQPVPTTIRPITAAVGMSPYLSFEASNTRPVTDIALEVTTRHRCWDTVFDEQAALALPWPTNGWPPEAASWFQTQFGVDYVPQRPEGQGNLVGIARDMLGGRDPRTLPPVLLAKTLTAGVIDRVQITRGFFAGNADVFSFSGFLLDGAVTAYEQGRGTDLEAASLLVGLMRAAGLPARLVAAYEEFDEDSNDISAGRRRVGALALTAYVEFYLYDEAAKARGDDVFGGWIPVDVRRMRSRSSKAPPVNQRWPFFGNHDELHLLIPIAFHLHPPLPVASYGGAVFFGISAEPGLPACAAQNIFFNVSSTPVRGKP